MKVKELIEWLSLQDRDDDLTFYFLKNDVLTNCQLETIIETDMGVELTIQDTEELQDVNQGCVTFITVHHCNHFGIFQWYNIGITKEF